MAKIVKLSKADIIIRADADLIAEALEGRRIIEKQLELREEAYRKIAEIEIEIEKIIGEQGKFVFPAQPFPVAGINIPKSAIKKKKQPVKNKKQAEKKEKTSLKDDVDKLKINEEKVETTETKETSEEAN
ncbi:MAG: hypothetical protein U9O87_08115 [Verrucomicrobiota bacterium]|nr:hypothetical protein [Verrucomicrobiota bacterium]